MTSVCVTVEKTESERNVSDRRCIECVIVLTTDETEVEEIFLRTS